LGAEGELPTDPHKGGRTAGEMLRLRLLACFDHESGFSALLTEDEIVERLTKPPGGFSRKAVMGALKKLTVFEGTEAPRTFTFPQKLGREGVAQVTLVISGPAAPTVVEPVLRFHDLRERGRYYWIRGRLSMGWEPPPEWGYPLIPLKNGWFPGGPAKCEACGKTVGEILPPFDAGEILKRILRDCPAHWQREGHPPAPVILTNGGHVHPADGRDYVAWMEYAGHGYQTFDEAWRLIEKPPRRLP
jgi:hypothetical protein